LTGKPISKWQKEHGFNEAPFDTLKVGLCRERTELYSLIDRRCDRMIEEGLVDEVKGLSERGYNLDMKPLQSVGYRHAGWVLRGQMTLTEAVFLMKRDTRRLAKRQLTWFRSDKEIRWFHPQADRARIKAVVREFLN
jgi:tRNA dimethylallyltransferase